MERLISIIEEKRRILHEFMDMYGINDNRVLTKSRELDKLIAVEQRRRLCLNTVTFFNVSVTK